MDELTAATRPLVLSERNLPRLPAAIDVPRYRRRNLSPGMVHIGVGNFHRAHQAWYLHRLMQAGEAQDWAILGAGVLPYDAAMRDRLLAQDCLTTLIELAPDRSYVEVIGSMIDYVPVVAGNGPLIEALAKPAIRLVSLTVTEGGYYIDPATGAFDAQHADIVHDTQAPASPKTAFGALVDALRRRRDEGLGPLTLLSCDNLQGNGGILRQTVVGLASLIDDGLARWIDTRCTFPNSMVDSIVPATGSAELALVKGLGIDDAAPVTHENFRQWVIEDNFCVGRPNWDQVGATFTDDVHGYEAMKLRVLNAGHQVLANAGEILGLPTIDTCMNHPLVGAFFRSVQRQEILPHVDGVPGTLPAAYLDQVITRFENPAVRDTTRRVAFDGSSRHTGFVHPIIRDALAVGAPIDGLAMTEALWARMCGGEREDGSTIAPNDPHWHDLQAVAVAAKDEPLRWLRQAHIYGDIADSPTFANAFERALNDVWQKGVAGALRRYQSA